MLFQPTLLFRTHATVLEKNILFFPPKWRNHFPKKISQNGLKFCEDVACPQKTTFEKKSEKRGSQKVLKNRFEKVTR